ncbi:MAG: hypothetical protein NXI32_11015, partial [bacterium]|nr:hypothetical protein [bacterium]
MLIVRFTGRLIVISFLVGWIQAASAQSDDLSRLIHPEVAERLSLDDGQRAELQQFLQERGEKLAQAADDAAKKGILSQFSDEILGVLTDEQRGKFFEDVPQQKLTFQFRDMKWEEVLAWFASQQDLTLVMDRTPSGTFTFSDTRAYSAAEGIDLLNSILLTRGFTLLRRNKMLLVMELNDSIPIELIPRVAIEQLAERGKFELVSVMFPLAGRPIDVVLAEVKPYLSNFGRAVPLARGGQLLMIETAGKMSTINELIASVPIPKQSPKAEAGPKPEPVFAAYPLGELDGAATLETIKKLIPSEQLAVDSKMGLLSAYVIPAQQLAIKAALEQMAVQTSERPTVSTAYRYSRMTAAEVIAQITALVPEATVTATGDRVLVTATVADQQLVTKALTALDVVPTSTDQAFEIFRVDAGDATPLGAALQSLLVDSDVVANPTNGTILVRGTSGELRLAAEAIEMWKQQEKTDKQQLRSFELQRRADSDWLAQVSKLTPEATTWLSEDGRRLIVLGKENDATAVEAALPELVRLLPEELDRQLKFYQLSTNQLDRRATLSDLPSELAGMKIVDGTNGELIVWGSAEQHAEFADLLDRLDHPIPAPLVTFPKVYPLAVRDPTVLTNILSAEFPRVQFTPSSDSLELTVVADETLHPKIEARLETLNAQLPVRLDDTLENYAVRGMSPAALEQIFTPLLGTARTTIDVDRNRLMVWADAKTHAELQEISAALAEEPDVMQQKVIVAYPLRHAAPTSAKSLIDQMVRDALVLADEQQKQVVVTGTLETQALVKAAVAQIDRAGSEREPAELRSYDVGKFQAATLLTALQPMWPDLKLSVDTTANKIIASGPATVHQELLTALDRLLSSPGGKEQTVRTYPVSAGDMSSLPTILNQIAPQALISSDAVSRMVTVWGTEEMQARVSQAIEQISKTARQANEPAT